MMNGEDRNGMFFRESLLCMKMIQVRRIEIEIVNEIEMNMRMKMKTRIELCDFSVRSLMKGGKD